jgi:hypothetical protein
MSGQSVLIIGPETCTLYTRNAPQQTFRAFSLVKPDALLCLEESSQLFLQLDTIDGTPLVLSMAFKDIESLENALIPHNARIVFDKEDHNPPDTKVSIQTQTETTPEPPKAATSPPPQHSTGHLPTLATESPKSQSNPTSALPILASVGLASLGLWAIGIRQYTPLMLLVVPVSVVLWLSLKKKYTGRKSRKDEVAGGVRYRLAGFFAAFFAAILGHLATRCQVWVR